MTSCAESVSALIPAVIGISLFSLIALEVLNISQASQAIIAANSDRDRLTAAADGGIASAIYQLGLQDDAKRLRADGQTHASYFGGVALFVTVQDEYGKVAINMASSDIERRLFAAAGIKGDRLDALVDALDDWKDADDDLRPHGAEVDYYSRQGIRPRNGPIHTIDELGDLAGMDSGLLARIRPAITPFVSQANSFSADSAGALALAAMASSIPESHPTNRDADASFDLGDMTGEMVSITAEARLPYGGHYIRTVVVEFTGDAANPYWIRYAS